MAKKSAKTFDWRIAAGAIAVSVFIALAFGVYQYFSTKPPVTVAISDTCLPEPVEQALASSTSAKRIPGKIDVYFDASGGMAGYVSASPNAIGNLTSLTRNFSQSSLYDGANKGIVTFRKFGEYRFDQSKPAPPPKIQDPATFARPGAYADRETRIADLLKWIGYNRSSNTSGSMPLSVIVTDLMLDDREAVDEFEASVGGILRNMMIEDGLSVGILAVRVPFDGNIFVGKETVRASVPDRPLIILLVGDPFQVRTFYEYLDTAETKPFSAETAVSDRDFALFGLEAGSITLANPEMSGVSSGFVARPTRERIPGAEQIRSYSFDEARSSGDAKGGVVVTLPADANVGDFEVIGNKPLWEGSIWRLDRQNLNEKGCAAGAAWVREGRLPSSGWTQRGQDISYQFTSDILDQAGMNREGVYLIQLLAGQRGIVENHPAAAWMNDWSMDNDRLLARLRASRSARRTGVPGLEPLRKILLAELMLPGREEIERSAAHLIIQTE